MFNIYEFDGSVQPGAMSDYFEIYDEDNVIKPIFTTESLDKATNFCYALGKNFTVHTLEAYYQEFGEE